MAGIRKFARKFPRPRCCTCTTAIGCLPRKGFSRVEVVTGETLSKGVQEIVSGLKPGEQVVQSALMFENAAEQ
jgi:hypothetical protein